MFNAQIKLRKEYNKYSFDNGDVMEVQGIRVCLAPKVEKFFILENITSGKKSNLELMEYCNPNLAQWYHNSPVGTELSLIEQVEHVPVNHRATGIKDIYENQENSL